MSLWLTMPRLPLYTCALGTGEVLRWSEAAEKAVADFGGPVRASKGAKTTREGLHVRGGEHSYCGSVWHCQTFPRGYRHEWT